MAFFWPDQYIPQDLHPFCVWTCAPPVTSLNWSLACPTSSSSSLSCLASSLVDSLTSALTLTCISFARSTNPPIPPGPLFLEHPPTSSLSCLMLSTAPRSTWRLPTMPVSQPALPDIFEDAHAHSLHDAPLVDVDTYNVQYDDSGWQLCWIRYLDYLMYHLNAEKGKSVKHFSRKFVRWCSGPA